MGGGYSIDNSRSYHGSYVHIQHSGPVRLQTYYVLKYDSDYIYIGDEEVGFARFGTIKCIAAYGNSQVAYRILVSYDESDNITWENCRITDSNLIDSLIDIQPACWQQYIHRDSEEFAVFAFPLK